MKLSQKEIQAARQLFEDQNYTKQIDCPAHPGEHTALLYEFGHRYGGMWECDNTGTDEVFSDACDHDPERENIDWDIEDVEVDDSHPDRRDGYTCQVYVCGGKDGCGMAIDRDVADPATDRAEMEADREDY